jgi:hypothetical protein
MVSLCWLLAVPCATVCQLEDLQISGAALDVSEGAVAESFSVPSGTKLVCPSSRVLIRVSYLAFRYWPYGPRRAKTW